MKSAASQLRMGWPPAAGVALILSAAATGISLAATGVSLGLAIGGFVAAAVLAPPLLSGWKDLKGCAAIIAGCVVGIGGVWLCMIGPNHATLCEWVELVAMLFAFLLLLSGVMMGLEAIGALPALSSMFTLILAMAWLTWPIWLPPGGLGGWLQRLVDVQPVLAANGILKFTQPWTEQAIAYRLTTLDQDMPIQLPGNPTLFLVFHLGIGLAIYSLVLFVQRSRAKAFQPVA